MGVRTMGVHGLFNTSVLCCGVSKGRAQRAGVGEEWLRYTGRQHLQRRGVPLLTRHRVGPWDSGPQTWPCPWARGTQDQTLTAQGVQMFPGEPRGWPGKAPRSL